MKSRNQREGCYAGWVFGVHRRMRYSEPVKDLLQVHTPDACFARMKISRQRRIRNYIKQVKRAKSQQT